MGYPALVMAIGIIVQSIYIYALGEIRYGLELLIKESENPKPYRILLKGVSVFYTLAWVGLVITVFIGCTTFLAIGSLTRQTS